MFRNKPERPRKTKFKAKVTIKPNGTIVIKPRRFSKPPVYGEPPRLL